MRRSLLTSARDLYLLLIALSLVSCARKEIAFEPYEIQHMATMRCLSKLNVWPRDLLKAMTQSKIESSNSDEWLGTKDLMQSNRGISFSVNQQVEEHPFMENCVNTVLTHFTTEFPSEKAAGFTMALMTESKWFESDNDSKEPLRTNLYELCKGELDYICVFESSKKD